MSYQKPNDPMAKIVIAVSSLVLLATVVVLLMSLFNTIQHNSIAADTIVDTSEIIKPDVTEKVISKEEAAANANIRPIGVIDLSASAQTSTANSGPRSGEDIYNTTCTACHGTGVLESPKFGDKAAWQPRFANDFDALLASALGGKGAMPAKGGNASLTDDEVKATIIYMLKEAGIDAGVTVDAPKENAEATKSTETPAPEATATATPTAEVAPAVVATEPAPTTEKASEAPVEATKAVEATETTKIAPEQPEAPAQAVAPAAATAPEAPEQPLAPGVAETPAATPAAETDTTEIATAAPASDASTAAPADNAEGEVLYKAKCFVCHATGVAGAPLFGNKELWAPRIAQGKDVLYNVSINGKGAMPPRGTAMDATDEQLKAAVDYMVSHAQ